MYGPGGGGTCTASESDSLRVVDASVPVQEDGQVRPLPLFLQPPADGLQGARLFKINELTF
jgi:hypothetical protein